MMKNEKDHHHHNAQDNDDNDKMSKIDSSHSNSGRIDGNKLSEFITSTVESDKRSSYESDKELLGNNNMLRRSMLLVERSYE